MTNQVIPEAAVEAAVEAWDHHWGDRYGNDAMDEIGEEVRIALEAAAPHMLRERVEVGYVCRHGHFQFIDDPDGDACGTKRVGTVFVEPDKGATKAELSEAVDYSIDSHHRKMEEWRQL